VLIAHRGGNSARALRAALDAEVDWLEVDVWWHYGRIVARHDAAVWRLPLARRGWLLRPAPRRYLTLDDILDAVRDTPVRLLIDLKGDAAHLPRALVETLQRRGAIERAALCGKDWAPLDAARALEPALQVAFSLGREEHLPPYLRRLADGTAPPMISITHRILTGERIAHLRERGVTIFSWTVNDPARARELVGWGVHGIISDSLRLLDGLRQHQDHGDPGSAGVPSIDEPR
jgi:glycerophosphoryl diester phosphodiesterase